MKPPCFDLDYAFEALYKRDPDIIPYRPYHFAEQFSALISPKFLEAQKKESFVDKFGQRWEREEKTEVNFTDMAALESTGIKEATRRELYWLVKLQGQPDLPAIQRLFGHGWVAPDSLTYALVTERSECQFSHLEFGTMETRLPGSTMLLAARCLSSVLLSLETLWTRYGLVCTSLCSDELSVRLGW